MLISSSFSKTFSAIYWPSSARLEWNFAFVVALGTCCFVHLAIFSIRQVSIHLHFTQKRTILFKELLFFQATQISSLLINCMCILTPLVYSIICEEESCLPHSFDVQCPHFHHHRKIINSFSNK